MWVSELGMVFSPIARDMAGECLSFVVGHLFDQGVECPGLSQCASNARCGKVAALYAFASRMFAAEEGEMSRMGYDRLSAHEDDHRRFLLRLTAIPHSNRCEETMRYLRATIAPWMQEHQSRFDGSFDLWAAERKPSATGLMA